jgi:hypothetical protein
MKTQTNQQFILANAKIECEFFLANALSINNKLRFAMQSHDETYEYYLAKNTLLNKINTLRNINKGE